MATPDEKTDIQAALAVLKQTFAKKIPTKVKEIHQSWDKLKSAPDDEAVLQLFHRQVHSLAGTGATYGFEAIAECAKKIELSLPEAEQEGGFRVSEIKLLLEKLEVAAGVEVKKKVPEKHLMQPQNIAVPVSKLQEKLIYFVNDDAGSLSTMCKQIQSFGYHVVPFSDLVLFNQALELEVPDIVIMNVIFGESPKAGIEHIARINEARIVPLNTIFISGSHDIEMRLEAVRAHSLAYIPKPVLVGSLIDTIEKFMHRIVEEPYRVLIVDDSQEQSQFAALILQHAGMQTLEVNTPLQVLDVLTSFQPDLILMDIYMPDCNGLELSKVIRQMDSYVNIPIVFLSSELDLKKKLGAMSLGGDDFLTKPVLPWHLTSAIASRVQRGRMISKLADTDGLTGLLNHIKSKERLEAELARAKRDKTSISIAMLDIDHFKKVNDTYGHPAGDRVLKSLANLFKQNLRQYDVIGRYGGEEFLVVLSNADSIIAKTIMDKLRIRFSEINHLSDDGDFHCSFSCGIASFPDFDSGAILNKEADKALYAAKNGGRNQVVISSH